MSDDLESEVTEEVFDLGPIGEMRVKQLKSDAFNTCCLSINSHERDSTGLRIHAGAHVLVRLIASQKDIIKDKKCCELGCGTGLVGLAVMKHLDLNAMYITDGDSRAIELSRLNIEALGK